MIGKGWGSLTLVSNTIDVLGGMKGKMGDRLSRWIEDHPDHPYSKVGPKAVEEALSSFISLFLSNYSFTAVAEENSLIPTGAGTFRETYLLPATMVAGTSLKKGDGLIAGFKGFKDFYAGYVSDQLGCRGITLSVPEAPCREITATSLARLMEKESFRENVAREIKKELRSETRVGFPALLGIQDPLKVQRGLEEGIGTPVFEIPILPPSIPGMRIFNRFKERLIQQGATFLLGDSISKVVVKGKRCEKVDLVNPSLAQSFSADRYILATGRFIGGGLVASRERIFEPVFDLPVTQPPSREGWFEGRFFDNLPHPVHRAGILTDSSLRPVDEKEGLLLENVWIAGTVLAGHDFIGEKSKEGIEIATGYAAAKQALSS
jgi:glycerol-3-phosphate dehydrogenase subunit B